MPTSPFLEVSGAYNLVFRYTINGYQVQIPGVVPMTSDGLEAVGANAQQVQGNSASGAADSGNPVKIGGLYVAAPAAVATGQRVNILTDSYGNQRSALVGGGFTPADGGTVVIRPYDSASQSTNGPLGTLNYYWSGSAIALARGDTTGADVVMAARATAGGATQFRRLATADTNLAVIKASAGRVYGFSIANNTASAKFVKLYNKATAPVLASDVPLRTIMVPANGMAAYHVGMGLAGFSAGIAMAATGGLGDTDATALAANDLIIQVDYA